MWRVSVFREPEQLFYATEAGA